MLARARLRDDPLLAHAFGKQDLSQAVIDLVRSGVIEFVAFEVDFRAAEMLGQSFGEIKRAWPA